MDIGGKRVVLVVPTYMGFHLSECDGPTRLIDWSVHRTSRGMTIAAEVDEEELRLDRSASEEVEERNPVAKLIVGTEPIRDRHLVPTGLHFLKGCLDASMSVRASTTIGSEFPQMSFGLDNQPMFFPIDEDFAHGIPVLRACPLLSWREVDAPVSRDILQLARRQEVVPGSFGIENSWDLDHGG